MNKSTWKKFERDVAKTFGTERTPLSGMVNIERLTKADTIHPELFIECKMRTRTAKGGFTAWTKFRDLEKQKHINFPFAAKMENDLLIFRPELLKLDYTTIRNILIKSKYVTTLFDDTAQKAKQENKVPVVAIKETGKKGFLLICKEKDIVKLKEHVKL